MIVHKILARNIVKRQRSTKESGRKCGSQGEKSLFKHKERGKKDKSANVRIFHVKNKIKMHENLKKYL